MGLNTKEVDKALKEIYKGTFSAKVAKFKVGDRVKCRYMDDSTESGDIVYYVESFKLSRELFHNRIDDKGYYKVLSDVSGTAHWWSGDRLELISSKVKSKEPLMPRAGERYRKKEGGREFEVVFIEYHSNGNYVGDLMAKEGHVESFKLSRELFHNRFELIDVPQPEEQRKKRNNDGNATCYACGEPTKVIDTGLAKVMQVCIKCGK